MAARESVFGTDQPGADNSSAQAGGPRSQGAAASHLHGAGGAEGNASAKALLEDDFFYTPESLKAPEDNTNRRISAESVALFHSFGFASHRRNNLHFIEEHILLSSIGNVLIFLNLKTSTQRYIMGIREGSIGAIAVHPSKAYFAVAEVSETEPNIYVYEYPSLKPYRVLRGGADRGYSDLCFNSAGDKIASVAIDPDYMLTIWNWKQEKTILKSKAFSQDVYRIAFSPDNDGILTTSGMGHIKFWRMSSTFTGLKLQGYLGKFGASELSDISAFIQLPDGKVLSSTETGNMLLWDGGMIKCEIGVKGHRLCHQGRIEIILLVENEVITAGEDGIVRVWDLETIDNADVTSATATSASAGTSASENASAATTTTMQSRVFEMEPIDEILIAKDVMIKSIVRYTGSTHDYLIQDQHGHLFRLNLEKRSSDKLLSFHAGAVMSVDTSPISHVTATLGSDGYLRIYDHVSKTMLNRSQFDSGGCSMRFLPEILDSSGNTMIAGFADGVLRIISYTPVGMVLQNVFKPHVNAVTTIAVSSDGKLIATGSDDKTVFFFQVSAKVDSEGQPIPYARSTVRVAPIGFITLPGPIARISISPDDELFCEPFKDHNGPQVRIGDGNIIIGKRLLVALKNGELYSGLISPSDAFDTSMTFEIPAEKVNLQRWKFFVPEAAPVAKSAVVGVADAQKEQAQQQNRDGANENTTSADAPAATSPTGDQGDTPSQQQPEKPEKPAEPQPEPSLTRTKSTFRKSHGIIITPDSPFTAIVYLTSGYFLASVTNTENEAEIRLGHVLMPARSRLLLVHSAPISELRLTTSTNYILVGTCDGMSAVVRCDLPSVVSQRWESTHETYLQYSNAFNERIRLAVEQRAKDEAMNGVVGTPEASLKIAGQYWMGHGHDIIQGRVNGIQMSFDDAFLCSAGGDGGVLVWRIGFESFKQGKEEKGDLDEQSNQIEQPEDITDANTYSIQEAKVKSEKDREIEQAESKKQVMRNYIQDLRNEFMRLVAENDRLASEKQLPRHELNVDPYLHQDIECETTEKIASLHKEMAWISEKESIGPAKLCAKFLDPVETEHIELRGFKTTRSIATFRTLKLNQNIDSLLQPLMSVSDHAATTDLGDAASYAIDADGDAHKNDQLTHTADHDVTTRQTDTQTSMKKSRKQEHKTKLEVRKQLRAERASIWSALMDEKPDDKYEDPKDVAAIRYAQHHMGDYKLKTADNYIVPEGDRIDADKKRRQILLLRESINMLKEQFNRRVLKARSTKADLVAVFAKYYSRLVEINDELGRLGDPVIDKVQTYALEESAFPQHRNIVTSADIAALQRDRQVKSQWGANGGGGDGGDDFMSGFGSSMNASAANTQHAGGAGITINAPGMSGKSDGAQGTKIAGSTSTTSMANKGMLSPDVSGIGRMSVNSNRVSTTSNNDTNAFHSKPDSTTNKSTTVSTTTPPPRGQLTALEIETIDVAKTQLNYEKHQIIRMMETRIAAFDATIDILRKDRILLEGDLKFADIKLLLLYQEWVLLKEFEKYDMALAEKFAMKKAEKADIDIKIADCQDKLASKKMEIETVIVKEREIQEEVVRVIGENNKHEEYLNKVFKRKIKRSKKKAKEGSGQKGETADTEDMESNAEDDEDADSSFDSDMDSDDSDEEEDFEEKCPLDSDPSVWDRILDLRDRRLDQEEMLTDIQKSVESLKKENDSLIKKEKVIGTGLKSAETEIQDFQTQKQRKLNELDVVVSLRFHQVQILEHYTVPVDLSLALVFVDDGLTTLRTRIRELQQEKLDIKKQHKELRRQHVSFVKNKKEKSQKLMELSDRARDVQMLKFGQIIDLEKLERLGVNKTADELREKLQMEDNKRLKELEECEAKLSALKEHLTDVTKENTVKLESLVRFKEQRYRLEDALNAAQASVTAEYSGPQRKDIVERDKLIALVQSQAQQIESLKHEIETLIRKPVTRQPMIRMGKTPMRPMMNMGVSQALPPLSGSSIAISRHDVQVPMTTMMASAADPDQSLPSGDQPGIEA